MPGHPINNRDSPIFLFCLRPLSFTHRICLVSHSDVSDGLVDCGDSNCCEHPACRESIMCVYFADPVDVLLRSVSILRMMILRLTMVMMVGSRHLLPVPDSSLRSGS